MMKRFLNLMILGSLAGVLFVSASATVSACPMCKAAAEQDENQPKAYMYSILFMLAMPAVIFSSFGYGLYRMNQRENEYVLPEAEPQQESTDSPSL